MTGLMLFSSFLDLSHNPGAVALITHLGYPEYFISFIGLVRLAGIITILLPFPWLSKLKEWAYAGLIFDLVGAIYSHWAIGDPFSVWGGPFTGLILTVGSYIYFHKRILSKNEIAVTA